MARTKSGIKMKTIGINMKQKAAEDLENRASSMHLSVSRYCKVILQQWLDSGKKLELKEK